MAEARAVKEIIRSCKGLTLRIFACATVDLEKFCHVTLLTGVNNAVDGRHLFLIPTTVDASDAIR